MRASKDERFARRAAWQPRGALRLSKKNLKLSAEERG